ncbi:MAG TPA: GTP cyclohydrolase [Pseudobdellovibrionaceae bacterium]|nr:GTP cyclohydrolase [Pseudobdellovibrionaceae bacterium]
MEKWAHSLTRGLGRLQNSFESLLETDGGKKDPDAPPFEPSRDPALVEGMTMGLPDDHIDKAVILFSRLALLFDGGILLENRDGRWTPQATFRDGTARHLRLENKESVALPEMNSLSVLKTDGSAMTKKLGLDPQALPATGSAYILRPVPDFAYVLFSSLPDLWLKDHMERTTHALSRGFAQ